MKLEYSISAGHPFCMGVMSQTNGIHIAMPFPESEGKECGMLLYKAGHELARIVFPECYKMGEVYVLFINMQMEADYTYLFFCGEERFADPYAHIIRGREKWGRRKEDRPRAAFAEDTFDWEDDMPLRIPYEDSVFYSLHVRGFTKHASSQVSARGTFAGLAEKIPYLQQLGITAIECMPVYEFDEIILNPAYQESLKLRDNGQAAYLEGPAWKQRINYWGFGDGETYYMAPKAAYAKDPQHADRELKLLIRQLHKNGIEIILQMYFSPRYTQGYIREVLRYWVSCYHVDGFHLFGTDIPMRLLGTDPYLKHTKLIHENPEADAVYKGKKIPYYRNLACYGDAFRYDARRFLKGDEGMLSVMAEHMRQNSSLEGVINHITDYRGFTLSDLVSYNRKHNEENGEDNRDGSDYNYSWNCGVEGSSRKRAILQMRLTQRKNALAMLFLSQGTPLLLAGDEMGRSMQGNNNAYCQDNKINWLDWKLLEKEAELFTYTKELIRYRKEHPILHSRQTMQIMDSLSCGYPDLSYHAEQAWYAHFENYYRHMAVLYCGMYEKKPDGTEDDFIYIIWNMHWEKHTFALPTLPQDYVWTVSMTTKEIPQQDTADKTGKEEKPVEAEISAEQAREITALGRSVIVLTGKKQEFKKKKRHKK